MVLRSDALAGYCIVFLPVDGVDDVAKPFSFFSSCESFPRCPVDRSLLGLEIFEERTERREAGILSLALDALLSPDERGPNQVSACLWTGCLWPGCLGGFVAVGRQGALV